MTELVTKKFQLYYVYDPMCSWCWGYRPTWVELQAALNNNLPDLEVVYTLGGLAPDSDEPMPKDMQQFLSSTWHKINAQLGTQFNFDFWTNCQPRRSTYPSCRACLIAREFGLEEQMIFAIQQAYYLQAQNPSDNSTLITLAGQIGIDETVFSEKLTASLSNQKLMSEIHNTHSLPIRGFPSLVLSIDGNYQAVPLNYQDWKSSFEVIREMIKTK
jgi:putative protein-disulfide isomerase